MIFIAPCLFWKFILIVFFFEEQATKTIHPDVILIKEKKEFIISINEKFFPKIKIDNEIQSSFAEQKKNIPQKDYLNLQKNYQEAKNILSNLDYRKVNLLKVVKVLLEEQKDFFHYGMQFIKPYTLEKII